MSLMHKEITLWYYGGKLKICVTSLSFYDVSLTMGKNICVNFDTQ
jgi:hypothetical protein